MGRTNRDLTQNAPPPPNTIKEYFTPIWLGFYTFVKFMVNKMVSHSMKEKKLFK